MSVGSRWLKLYEFAEAAFQEEKAKDKGKKARTKFLLAFPASTWARIPCSGSHLS